MDIEAVKGSAYSNRMDTLQEMDSQIRKWIDQENGYGQRDWISWKQFSGYGSRSGKNAYNKRMNMVSEMGLQRREWKA